MTKYDFTLGPEQTSSKKVNTSEGCIDGFHISLKPRNIRHRYPLPVVPAGKEVMQPFVIIYERRIIWFSFRFRAFEIA